MIITSKGFCLSVIFFSLKRGVSFSISILSSRFSYNLNMLSRSLSRIAFATIAVVSYQVCVLVYILVVCSVVLRWLSLRRFNKSCERYLDVHWCVHLQFPLTIILPPYHVCNIIIPLTMYISNHHIMYAIYIIQNTKAFAPQKPVGFHLSRNLSSQKFSTSTTLNNMPICIVVEAGKSALVSFYMYM